MGRTKNSKKDYYLKLNRVQRLVVVNENKINSSKPKCGQCSSKLFYLSLITRFCRSSFSYSGMTKTNRPTDGPVDEWTDGLISPQYTQKEMLGVFTKFTRLQNWICVRVIKFLEIFRKKQNTTETRHNKIGGETKWKENNKSFFKFTLNWNSMSFDFPRNSFLWS